MSKNTKRRKTANQRIYEKILMAAQNMDWDQVVGNGGPPCFHLDCGRFCGRAERWDGHNSYPGSPRIHKFVPFHVLVEMISMTATK